ncbi:hypothetical protein [Serratia fonticola]|jgi:hypothetical protein|uniref:hypothetical protein n=1 Tax=Serratia fonticola TaxID=47917 RepID=UPI00141543B0|nr:hypothetical protein [Serratia fonticola]MBP0997690.1 hypothetical protein [Serratia fonticola]MBP1001778.1 hypothetical protein [Serratia fonticola]MBP1011707.1 hypothetical protein [Serratia fonticola]MBP1016294.1 hypothetical protein [Serratia fonticola]MBP1035994.1 hypothetical protein [Serratia fonticola]
MLLKQKGVVKSLRRRSALISAEALVRNTRIHEAIKAELAGEMRVVGSLGCEGRLVTTGLPRLKAMA